MHADDNAKRAEEHRDEPTQQESHLARRELFLDAVFGRRCPSSEAALAGRHYPPGPPATQRQIARLTSWGYPHDATRLSAEEAQDLIALAESWGDKHPLTYDEMRHLDDAYDDGEAPWPPPLSLRQEEAIRQRFRWPFPQYRREEQVAWSRMTLAERVALRRSEGLPRLTNYVRTRLSRADHTLRAVIQSLLTEAEWQGVLEDPPGHQIDPT